MRSFQRRFRTFRKFENFPYANFNIGPLILNQFQNPNMHIRFVPPHRPPNAPDLQHASKTNDFFVHFIFTHETRVHARVCTFRYIPVLWASTLGDNVCPRGPGTKVDILPDMGWEVLPLSASGPDLTIPPREVLPRR